MSMMDQAILVPLFALAIWLLASYADSKFRYYYEGKDAEVMARQTTGIKRFLISQNRTLRLVGLGMLWAGFSVATVLENGSANTMSMMAYGMGAVGLIVYIVSRMWPFLTH
jgi:hypothetical protein